MKEIKETPGLDPGWTDLNQVKRRGRQCAQCKQPALGIKVVLNKEAFQITAPLTTQLGKDGGVPSREDFQCPENKGTDPWVRFQPGHPRPAAGRRLVSAKKVSEPGFDLMASGVPLGAMMRLNPPQRPLSKCGQEWFPILLGLPDQGPDFGEQRTQAGSDQHIALRPTRHGQRFVHLILLGLRKAELKFTDGLVRNHLDRMERLAQRGHPLKAHLHPAFGSALTADRERNLFQLRGLQAQR